MNGEFMVEGWKYGLIEVDLMPTLADEITPLLGTTCSCLTDLIKWSGNRSSLAWI